MVNLNLENLYRRNIMTLKEQLDKFNEWHDEDYEDERGAIEYDNFDDHESEDGYGRDEFIEGSEDYTEDDLNGIDGDPSVEEWWEALSSGDVRTEDEKETDAEADSFLTANESIATLNAKEAKLREALEEIEAAKAKLAK